MTGQNINNTNWFSAMRDALGVGVSDDDLAAPRLSRRIYAGSAMINVMALAMPITILQVYDRVLPNASMHTLNALLFGLVGVVVTDAALKCLRAYLVNWSSAAFTHQLSRRALTTIMTSPSHGRERQTAAEQLDRLGAISAYGDFLGGASRLIAVDFLFIPIFAIVITIVGGPLIAIPVILFAVFGYVGIKRTQKLEALFQEREQMDARKNDFILEILKSMPTIKSLAMEPLIMRRYERLQMQCSDIARQTMTTSSDAQTFASLYASISTVCIVGLGAILVIQGSLTIGGLACCMLLSSQLLQPLMRALSTWNEIQLAKLKKQRIAHVFNEAPETTPPSSKNEENAVDIARPASISISGLTIRYGDRPPLFENIELTIAPGTTIAIRGGDGSGRTSLLRAIAGSFVPEIGEIRIDGTLLREDNARTIRDHIGFVQQEPTIFRGTILDNLTVFGKTPIADCLAAARSIGLDGEISRMPLGYDTVIRSATSADLPASTAQRICIARTLAQRPAILILDEANTALDLSADKALIAALQDLHGEMTIILSTHRPSMIKLADQALEIGDGVLTPIAETASPELKMAAE